MVTRRPGAMGEWGWWQAGGVDKMELVPDVIRTNQWPLSEVLVTWGQAPVSEWQEVGGVDKMDLIRNN